MTTNGLLQIAFYFVVLIALAKPLGAWMARVYEAKSLWGERLIYRLCGVRPEEEMDWKGYAFALLLFGVVSLLVLYLQQRLQQWLPLNPEKLGAVTTDS